MHYYPSTMGELVEAVMRRRDDAMRAGRVVTRLTFGRFQMEMILKENERMPVGDPYGKTVSTFMDIPVDEVPGWAFDHQEK